MYDDIFKCGKVYIIARLNIFFKYFYSIYNKNHNILIKMAKLILCCPINSNICRGIRKHTVLGEQGQGPYCPLVPPLIWGA